MGRGGTREKKSKKKIDRKLHISNCRKLRRKESGMEKERREKKRSYKAEKARQTTKGIWTKK